MLWIPPKSFSRASSALPADRMDLVLPPGLSSPRALSPRSRSFPRSRAVGARAPTFSSADRGRSRPGRPGLPASEGNNGVGAAAVASGICGPGERIAEEKSAKSRLFPASFSGLFARPRSGNPLSWETLHLRQAGRRSGAVISVSGGQRASGM